MHRFTESDGGVLMEDVLHYGLPGGFVGELFGAPIHKKVHGIFSHREEILNEIFPAPAKSAGNALKSQ